MNYSGCKLQTDPARCTRCERPWTRAREVEAGLMEYVCRCGYQVRESWGQASQPRPETVLADSPGFLGLLWPEIVGYLAVFCEKSGVARPRPSRL